MIVGNLKPLEEIVAGIADYQNVFVFGCGGCVSVCLTGGDREAHALARELGHVRYYEKEPPRFSVGTSERQCEPDFLKSFSKIPEGTDAVLTLACGAGVQTMAAVFDPLPIIPAINTTFMGATSEAGVWQEMCRGCGDCMLAHTGGICPIARCAKSLLHGPCGGSSQSICEVSKETACIWDTIVAKKMEQGRLEDLLTVKDPKDWRSARDGGPRRSIREELAE